MAVTNFPFPAACQITIWGHWVMGY